MNIVVNNVLEDWVESKVYPDGRRWLYRKMGYAYVGLTDNADGTASWKSFNKDIEGAFGTGNLQEAMSDATEALKQIAYINLE